MEVVGNLSGGIEYVIPIRQFPDDSPIAYSVRIIFASCSVAYSGRGDTRLGRADRMIMVKDDGSVSVHSDKSNKPLNYMGADGVHSAEAALPEELLLAPEGLVWRFDSRRESLRILIHEIYHEVERGLGEEPGLERDGTEAHLQAWLATNVAALGSGYTFVQREYPTGAGPVDLLVTDADGAPVAVEVKRTAILGAADQAARYREAINQTGEWPLPAQAIIAALDVRPKTRALAEKRGIDCVIINPRAGAAPMPTPALEDLRDGS